MKIEIKKYPTKKTNTQPFLIIEVIPLLLQTIFGEIDHPVIA